MGAKFGRCRDDIFRTATTKLLADQKSTTRASFLSDVSAPDKVEGHKFGGTGDKRRHFSKSAPFIPLLGGLLSLILTACGSAFNTQPVPTTTSTTVAASSGSGASTSGSSVSTSSSLPVGNVATGLEQDLVNPSGMPPGSNNWSCVPSAQHPYPVILVHGTMGSEAFTWQALSPMLTNAGYCVYAFDYGGNIGPFYGLGDVAASAQTLATFVTKVLASTGAGQVDIVGHSQGGMMPRYYIQDLAGASKVHMLVGIAPSNEGTTLDGIVSLGDDFSKLLGVPLVTGVTSQLPASFGEQEQGSSFLTALNKGGGTSPGVSYVNIESKYDEVITPYTNAFLPTASNVQNITLQDDCATDFTEHIGIVYDPVTLGLVMNALGANDPNYKPPCSLVLPVIGSLGNI